MLVTDPLAAPSHSSSNYLLQALSHEQRGSTNQRSIVAVEIQGPQ
jgi:hypothetical protein